MATEPRDDKAQALEDPDALREMAQAVRRGAAVWAAFMRREYGAGDPVQPAEELKQLADALEATAEAPLPTRAKLLAKHATPEVSSRLKALITALAGPIGTADQAELVVRQRLATQCRKVRDTLGTLTA